jgi:transcriptional regulator with XRE-family HTH domain
MVSENREAVRDAIIERMLELGINQKQLAKNSGVAPATIRYIENDPRKHRPSPRTMEAISKALGWQPEHLDNVLYGRLQRDGTGQVTTEVELLSRLDALLQLMQKINVVLEQRLGGVVDVIYNNDSRVDITIEIKHAGPDHQTDHGR